MGYGFWTARYFGRRWFKVGPTIKWDPQEDKRKAFIRARRNARIDQQMAEADAIAKAIRAQTRVFLEDPRKAQQVKEAIEAHEARKAHKSKKQVEMRKVQEMKKVREVRAQEGREKQRQAAQAAQEAQRRWRAKQ